MQQSRSLKLCGFRERSCFKLSMNVNVIFIPLLKVIVTKLKFACISQHKRRSNQANLISSRLIQYSVIQLSLITIPHIRDSGSAPEKEQIYSSLFYVILGALAYNSITDTVKYSSQHAVDMK